MIRHHDGIQSSYTQRPDFEQLHCSFSTSPHGLRLIEYAGGASPSPTGKLTTSHVFGVSVDADGWPFFVAADSISARNTAIFCAIVPAGSFHHFVVPLPPGGRQNKSEE